MVSGYDKTPPEPRYEPDFTPAGRVIIIVIVAVLAIALYRYFM